jgi:hypothetical protein
MGINSQGRYLGTDSAFKYRKSKSIGAGIKLGSQRKDSLEKKAIDDKHDQEQAKTKEISRRQKERRSMRKELEKRVAAEETNPNRNTDERRKVVNVGRPDTAKNPIDTRSKLAKQGEIKKKIIDENEVKTMTFQKYHNLPDDLVAAVRSVLEGKNPFAKKDDDKKLSKDDDSDDDDDMKAKSKKDDDDDDDADQDKKVGVDGKKTKVDLNPKMKMANEELKGNQKKLDKNHNGRLDAQDFKMLRKEEVEQVDESMKFDKSHAPMPELNQPSLKAHKAAADWHREYYEQSTNNKHKLLHKDRMLHHNSMVAAMKSMGVQESMVALSDEETARILAKLNEADDEDEKHDDGPEHIVMQLRKAKSLGAANRPIHFHDGSKVKVASGHVQKALDMHGSFKKAPEKDEFTQKLQASHASFKKAIGAE